MCTNSKRPENIFQCFIDHKSFVRAKVGDFFISLFQKLAETAGEQLAEAFRW